MSKGIWVKFSWQFVAGCGDSSSAALKCLLPLLGAVRTNRRDYGFLVTRKGVTGNYLTSRGDILGNSNSAQYCFEFVNLL